MKRIKRMTSTILVLGVIMMGAANARAGLVMSDLADSDPCTVSKTEKRGTKVDHGVIVVGLMQVFGKDIIEAIFGKSDTKTNCGVIVVG